MPKFEKNFDKLVPGESAENDGVTVCQESRIFVGCSTGPGDQVRTWTIPQSDSKEYVLKEVAQRSLVGWGHVSIFENILESRVVKILADWTIQPSTRELSSLHRSH